MKRSLWPVLAILALSASPVLAQGAGGGTGATQSSPSAASCIAPGADGKPSRKLSSEEVCPLYSFWRDDCLRAGKLGEMEALGHCGAPAMGLSDRDIATGSIRRAR